MQNTGIIYTSEERTPTVLPELAELLPPLSDEQLSLLEADLLKNGCYTPIIVNEDLQVVDGHNRFRICERHDLPFQMAVFAFDDLLEAKQWALDTQKSRRNLTVNELCKIAMKLRPEVEARAAQRKADNGGDKSVDADEAEMTTLSPPPSSTKTSARKELADAVGVGEVTMGKAMKIEDEAPQPVKDAVDNGELSIHQGYTLTRELQELPEDERDEAAAEAVEREKARKEMAKKNARTDEETKIANTFSTALDKAQALDVTEQNVKIWVTHANLYGELLDGAIEDAAELSVVFASLAKLLKEIRDMDWRESDET